MNRISFLVTCVAAMAACGDNRPEDAAPNEAPVVDDASVTTAEDAAVTVELMAEDPEQATLEITLSAPAHGTASRDGRSFTYVPAPDYHGPDAVTVTVSDGALIATAIITITVTPVNDAPVASADALATAEDQALEIDVSGLTSNDSDIDGDALAITAVGTPSSGTVVLTGGEVTFTPAADFDGDVTFTYTVSDGTATDTATVTVAVGGLNDPPVANADATTIAEDGVATLAAATLLANDTDADGQTLVLTAVGPASTGVVALAAGTVTYTPPPDFHGSATFDYTASDGAAAATATVTVTVTPVNDVPVATAIGATTSEDTAVTLTLAASDADGDALTFAVVTGPTAGTLGGISQVTPTTATVIYTPDANRNGPDSFTFTAADGAAPSTAATATVTVGAVDDTPVATATTATTSEDTAVVITLAGSDPEGSPLTFTVVTGPTAGTLGTITQATPTTATVVYTPAANSTADDGFAFRVDDGAIASAAAAVTIDVVPVNDVPVATATSAITDEDTAVTLTFAGSDADGDTLGVIIDAAPTHGTLSIPTRTSATSFTATYTPAADYNGPDRVGFHVGDGTSTSAGATVTLDVTAVNDPPIAFPGSSTLDEDGVVNTLMSGSDADGQPLTFAIVTPPSHGTLGAIVALGPTLARVAYTPAANYSGPDSYTFSVSDGTATSAAALDTITVRPINDAPVAYAATVTTSEDTAVVITLVGADVEDAPLGFAIVTPPVAGTLGPVTPTSAFTASVTYTPPANGTADTSFTFRVDDGTASSAAATVAIDVVPVNDPPAATAGGATTAPATPVTLTLSGTDPDSDPLSFTIVTPPASGTLGAITQLTPASASVVYTPASGSVADDGFTFRSHDGAAFSAPAPFAVVVIGAACGDGAVEETEGCDDFGTSDGDGCSAGCAVEPGWACTGSPSACAAVCGDGTLIAGEEACDDGNQVDTDGCTSLCVVGRVCAVANPAIATASRFATDPATGHCYVSFDGAVASQAPAQTACLGNGGHLATISGAAEQTVVVSVQHPAQTPWIGASDAASEGTFAWVTGEPIAFTRFAAGQPDHVGAGPHCLQLAAAGDWIDSTCAGSGSFGRICELVPQPCGNGLVETGAGETCDDGNTTDGDGCSATCTLELAYISEYVEGSSQSSPVVERNQAIELYNPRSTRFTQSCQLRIYQDGFTFVSQSSAIALDIPAHGTHVVCANAPGPLLAPSCQTIWIGMQVMNGNDVFELVCGGVSLDSIGQVGTNPATGWGSGDVTTLNHTLRRKCSVHRGDPTPFDAYDPVPEWDSFPIDTFTGLGSHGCP